MEQFSLVFERSRPGRRSVTLPQGDTPSCELPEGLRRQAPLPLPELAEVDLVRHYTGLSRRAFGVDNGFYPLGSCTMKYNPRINEEIASLPGFTEIHPLQPEQTAQGCLEAMALLEGYLAEITGMDAVTLQPAAGAHGEWTGLMLIRAYHLARGDSGRTKVLVPDSAHGTNPASAVMAGFTVVNVPSDSRGNVDVAALRELAGPDTAALMLTNPNTLGLFEENILELTQIVHDAGGLVYYDGANLNAIMGVARPGDMGFDVVHLNLHKTFSTPHGGGGPGSGPVGCKSALIPYLPGPRVIRDGEGYRFERELPESIGQVKSFYGNFGVELKALSYILSLGREGIGESAKAAVLNANYLMERLKGAYDIPYGDRPCMHEFVMSLERQQKELGVTAMDVAKSLLDEGIHPPTMYFPLIVHEALMVEPTETESRETLDHAVEVLLEIAQRAKTDPESLHQAPRSTVIGRPDEVQAARKPRLRWQPEQEA